MDFIRWRVLLILSDAYFIAKFDQCIFLLFVKVTKMSTRLKELLDEVSTYLSTVDWSTKMLEGLFSAFRTFWQLTRVGVDQTELQLLQEGSK